MSAGLKGGCRDVERREGRMRRLGAKKILLNFSLFLLYYMSFVIQHYITLTAPYMPLHKSAEKRLRQSERRNARNRARKKEMKVLVKTMQKLIDTSADKAAVEVAYRSAVQKIDRLGVKNYIHPNKASRKKSQLTRLMNSYGKAE